MITHIGNEIKIEVSIEHKFCAYLLYYFAYIFPVTIVKYFVLFDPWLLLDELVYYYLYLIKQKQCFKHETIKAYRNKQKSK